MTTDATPAVSCDTPGASPVNARLLTGSQYSHSVLDLFGVGGDPGGDLGDSVFDTLDDVRVEQRADVAASVAEQAVATLAQWAPCVPAPNEDPAACSAQIIAQIGKRAFRRPLSPTEQTEMQTLFDAGIAEGGFETGVDWFLTGLLQTPDFMYQIVRPEPGEVAGEVRPLSAYDYASRLAFFVWDSPPDDALLATAESNTLTDDATLQGELTRMLGDERFLRGVESFYNRWLDTGGFREIARDEPTFDAAVVESLMTSLMMSVTELYSGDQTPTLAALLSGDTYYLNDVLREFYGLPPAGPDFAPASLTGEDRRGILTHPALMALLARPAESFPIGRGLFITRNFLCFEVPLPEGLEIPELPPIQEGLSTRDRLEAHTSDPVCAGCHSLFDPAGFALEAYDEVGRFRTVDHGKAVDTSGTMTSGRDVDGVFATGGELLERLSQSEDVRGCFAQRYLEYALSQHTLTPDEACSLEGLETQFVASGDLKQLVQLVASSEAFRLRLAEGVGQ